MPLKLKLFVIALSVLLLVATASFISFAAHYTHYAQLAWQGPSQLSLAAQPKEVIVVLTGDRGRIPAALELLRTRGTSRLIISGIWKGTTLTELLNSQNDSTDKANLQAIWQKIILESNSTSTIENAIESEKILKGLDVTRVILVTSDYHMSRSLALFKKLASGREYVAYPTVSEFTELLHGKLEHSVEGVSKFIVEYWKDFLFQFYLLQIL